jgi:3',5'-cyclic AMP phosphodiesterase CpdA
MARLLLGCLLMTVVGFIPLADAKERRFIALSDIHFNPFYERALIDTLMASPYEKWDLIFRSSPSKGSCRYGEEANDALLNSLLDKASQVLPRPDFILFSGDFIVHDFDGLYDSLYRRRAGSADRRGLDSCIYKTIGFVLSSFARRFPLVPVYFSIGNNDAFGGNYRSDWNDEFFRATARLFFGRCIQSTMKRDDFFATYCASGSYSLAMPWNKKDRIISLNTNFFSNRHKEMHGDSSAAAFAWLKEQLADAAGRNEKAWIVSHIPPGIDVYRTMQKACRCACDTCDSAMLLWKKGYNGSVLSMVRENAGTVKAWFAGHTHKDDFRLLGDSAAIAASSVPFIHITPAVSPVYGNNPAFQVFIFDDADFSLLDHATYCIDAAGLPAQWRLEYDFGDFYRQKGIDARSLFSVFKGIGSNPGIRDYYTTFHNTSSVSPIGSIKDRWLGYWTGILNLTDSSFCAAFNAQIRILEKKSTLK